LLILQIPKLTAIKQLCPSLNGAPALPSPELTTMKTPTIHSLST
jgi:hypothetical protein